jgi:hypothetical protein
MPQFFQPSDPQPAVSRCRAIAQLSRHAQRCQPNRALSQTRFLAGQVSRSVPSFAGRQHTQYLTNRPSDAYRKFKDIEPIGTISVDKSSSEAFQPHMQSVSYG